MCVCVCTHQPRGKWYEYSFNKQALVTMGIVRRVGCDMTSASSARCSLLRNKPWTTQAGAGMACKLQATLQNPFARSTKPSTLCLPFSSHFQSYCLMDSTTHMRPKGMTCLDLQIPPFSPSKSRGERTFGNHSRHVLATQTSIPRAQGQGAGASRCKLQDKLNVTKSSWCRLLGTWL